MTLSGSRGPLAACGRMVSSVYRGVEPPATPGLRADRPLVGPVDDGTLKPPGTQRGDNEAAALKRGIRLGVAGAAEGDQAVAVEVRAAVGALPDVMHLEAVRGEAPRFAPPAGAG